MDKVFVSNQVCEQLARQLVEEQAEMLKHKAIVEGIKQAILQKKTEVIKEKVAGKLFRLSKMSALVLDVFGTDLENDFAITFRFVESPDSILRNQHQFTRKEKVLIDDYTSAFCEYTKHPSRDAERKLYNISNHLELLKHGIKPVTLGFRRFSYDEAAEPEFFEKTGIEVDGFQRMTCEPMDLKDVAAKRYI